MCDYWQLGCAFTSEVVCIHVVNLYAVSMHLCVVCVCKGCMIMHIVSVEVSEMCGVCLMCTFVYGMCVCGVRIEPVYACGVGACV